MTNCTNTKCILHKNGDCTAVSAFSTSDGFLVESKSKSRYIINDCYRCKKTVEPKQ